MEPILTIDNLNSFGGNMLRQGDKSQLKYRLRDVGNKNLGISSKPCQVRMYGRNYTTVVYETSTTVSSDNTVTFTINKVLPKGTFYLEFTVGDYIFPTDHKEFFEITPSGKGMEANIIEIVGVDTVVRKAVDLINEDPSLIIDEDKLVGDIISNTGIGNINEYYQAFNDLKPKAEQAITKSAEALTKSQNALNVANGIDAKATNALSLSESADTLSKSVQEQFNQVIIDGDSSVEAAQARVDASGQTNPTLKARLDKEHNEVTAQLAQTKSEAERKRKLEDLEPEVLSAIEGGEGTSFNLLSIPQDKSVAPTKTTFAFEGKNKFNKDATINGYRINSTTGEIEAHADYYISDYMPVKPNTSYMRKWNYVTAFYDKELNKISHHNHSTNFEPVVSPDLAAYARITNYKTTLVDEQFEEGTVATTYEPYTIKIPKYNIYDSAPLLKYDSYPFQALATFNNDETGALEIKKAIKAIELFGADKAKKYNMGIIQKNFSTYGTGIYIYECNLDGTNNKVVAVTARPSYTHPLGVDVFEVAERNDSGISAKVYIDWSAISDGAQYVNNHYDKAGLDYRTYKSISSTNSDAVRIKLPPTIPAVVGKEINVYFENIILSDNLQNYKIDVTCTIGKHQNERWTAMPTSVGNYPITITVYKNGESIASATSSVVVKAANAGDGVTKKAIFIGDSTTDHGVYTNELINGLFSDDVMNLELLGTRGSGLNKHEGRSGWRASNYVNDATFLGLNNAFYNNGFDFTHYMTTQGYSGVDVVGIHLGINDTFNRGNDDETISETVNVLGYFDTMLDSIKAFDSAIQVAFLITIPPSKNQDAFGANYNSGQTQWRVKRNIFLFVEKLIDKYKGRENEGIYLVPTNVNLDTVNNMHTETVEVNSRNTKQITRQSNGVHPANEGYYQMADVIYYWLKGQY